MEEQGESKVITLEQMTREHPEEHVLVLRYQDRFGTCVLQEYTVFSGIRLLYKEFHRPDTVLRIQAPPREELVLEHCQQGCVECRDARGHFYLQAGDMGLRRTNGAVCDVCFPSAHYRGLDILLDMTPKTEAGLRSVNISLVDLMEKFRIEQEGFYFFRNSEPLAQLFAPLYSAPETLKRSYCKLKALESLLFLQGLPPTDLTFQATMLPAGQLRLAQEVHRYLLAHLSEPLTVEQLARQFNTSATRLKESFRRAYGTSIRAFVTDQRVRAACLLLRQTDRKVSDIAGEFGYANASKFAAAFQRIVGESPAQYRRKHQQL